MGITEAIEKGADYITDNKRPLGHRITAVVLVVTLVALIDNQLGFSYYYGLAQKTEQIEKLQSLIEKSADNKLVVRQLNELQQDVIQRKGLLPFLWSFTSLTRSATNSSVSQTNSAISGSIIETDRDLLYNFISVSGFTILFLLLVNYVSLFHAKLNANEIAAMILFDSAVLLFTLIMNFISLLIPTIADRPWINYGFNALISFGFVYGAFKLIASYGEQKMR